MERDELVRILVLNEIADDYENIDQIILPNVARMCATLGVVVERSDIVKAVGELIEGGLAKAYLLSSREPFVKELERMPAVDLVEKYFETYFYITKYGIDCLHSEEADSSWPFDDKGEPRL